MSVKLQSSDGEVFHVDLKIAQQSNTLRTMIENLGMNDAEVIPLPNVTAIILEKVIAWCATHKDDDPNAEGASDLELAKLDQNTLFELILAANYLDIKSLLDVTCKAMAGLIKKYASDEELEKTFNIHKDYKI